MTDRLVAALYAHGSAYPEDAVVGVLRDGPGKLLERAMKRDAGEVEACEVVADGIRCFLVPEHGNTGAEE